MSEHPIKHRASRERSHRASSPMGGVLGRVLAGAALGTTVLAVVAGVAVAGPVTSSGSGLFFADASGAVRSGSVSRDDDRISSAKQALLDAASSTGVVLTASEKVVADDARQAASALLPSHGWDGSQFVCLDALWTKESHWRVNAENPSGAYGIPQALPGSKMAAAGDDWQTNPVTQVTWGLDYIAHRWGTPCDAWANSQAKGWY